MIVHMVQFMGQLGFRTRKGISHQYIYIYIYIYFNVYFNIRISNSQKNKKSLINLFLQNSMIAMIVRMVQFMV